MTFWDEVAIRHVRVTALDGLEYEVLDGLVEDSAFGAHIERHLAEALYEQVTQIAEELQTRSSLILLPTRSFLAEAFEVAISEGVSLARSLSAAVAVAHNVPAIVISAVHEIELERAFGPTRVQVLAIEELY